MGPNNIQPFTPEFRKIHCASNPAWPKLTAALRIRLQAMRQRTFLLTTPEREGIYSNPFTGILFSCPRTLFNKKFRGATCCTQQNHTGERPYKCKQRAMNFSSDILLSRHIGERPYKCKHRGTFCTRNTQSSLIVDFGHKNKSKYFFYISQPHWLYGCRPRHGSSQQMA